MKFNQYGYQCKNYVLYIVKYQKVYNNAVLCSIELTASPLPNCSTALYTEKEATQSPPPQITFAKIFPRHISAPYDLQVYYIMVLLFWLKVNGNSLPRSKSSPAPEK